MYKYTPPLMKKVVNEYFGIFNLYLEAKLRIWSMAPKVTTWATRLLNQLDTFIEFHFIKNGNQDLVKKMPIHDMKVWAHDLDMVILMFEDQSKKQLASFVCLVNQMSSPRCWSKKVLLLVLWRRK